MSDRLFKPRSQNREHSLKCTLLYTVKNTQSGIATTQWERDSMKYVNSRKHFIIHKHKALYVKLVSFHGEAIIVTVQIC